MSGGGQCGRLRVGSMSFRRVLLVLAVLSPCASSSCVIVNINSSMDSALARACLEESYRKLRAFAYSEKWSDDTEPKRKNPEEKVNEVVNTSQESTRVNPSNNENSAVVQDSNTRQMLCMFVSGFSLAAGLLLFLGWTSWRPPPPGLCSFSAAPSSSRSCSSSDHDPRPGNSTAAEAGSTLGNQPYRSLLRRAQDDKQSSARTRITSMETAFTSTPNSSAVALGPQEFWL